MQIQLEKTILEQLSAPGVLAYVAVRLAEGSEATTAALASLVRARTGVMLEGLKELSVVAPGAVTQVKKKWRCGQVRAGEGAVQSIDSARFTDFVADLKKYWEFLNPDLPFEISGKDGIHIRTFLQNHRSWTQREWRVSLNNRKNSVLHHGHASKSEPLWMWVGRLDQYAAGRLGPYNKPVEGSGKRGEAVSIQQGNREAGATFLASVGVKNGK